MEKSTLKFSSLKDLHKFSSLLPGGYLINTNNLTITAMFSQTAIGLALEMYMASFIETSEKVYTYDLIY